MVAINSRLPAKSGIIGPDFFLAGPRGLSEASTGWFDAGIGAANVCAASGTFGARPCFARKSRS
jgi:hypothetical protein